MSFVTVPPSTQRTQPSRVKVGIDGRVVIPAEIRQRAGIGPGDELVIDADGAGVRLRTLHQAVAAAQAFFSDGLASGTLVSEELIRDRRAEAARE
jgi:AbrB family looped-hinge helix DNA binding protein